MKKKKYLKNKLEEEKGIVEDEQISITNPEKYILEYTRTAPLAYAAMLDNARLNKTSPQEIYMKAKETANKFRNEEIKARLAIFEKEEKGGSGSNRGEGESSVGGGAKRFKQSNYVYDAEVNGFPVRYQTCLMLVPYCNADHIPPKKISIEEAEVYAEEGEQPPLDSPSYIEYIKDKYGNLKRDRRMESLCGV